MTNKKIKKQAFIPIIIILLLTSVLLAACGGEKEPESYTIGILNIAPFVDPAYDGFKDGLAELDYVEGETVNYIYDGPVAVEALGEEAQKLIDAEVDMILCMTTPACLAVKQTTEDVPVIFYAVSDPQEAGLISDPNNPGGNITGVASAVKGAINEGQRVQWLKRMAPEISNVYVMYNPDDPVTLIRLASVQEAANTLGLELILDEVHTPEEADEAIANIPDDADAVLTFSERIYTPESLSILANNAIAKGLPHTAPGVDYGALMAYTSDLAAMGKQGSRLADQIFKGTNPGELPVESPEFFLIINMPAAEEIDLIIPGDVLEAADTIIR